MINVRIAAMAMRIFYLYLLVYLYLKKEKMISLSIPVVGQLALTSDTNGATDYYATSLVRYRTFVVNNVPTLQLIETINDRSIGTYPATNWQNSGTPFADLPSLVSFLNTNNIAVASAGGGGGGGGTANPYPGSDYAKNAPLTSIDGKTKNPNKTFSTATTPALTGTDQIVVNAVAAGIGVFIQNLDTTLLAVNLGAPASIGSGSILLPQYGTFQEYVTQDVHVLGTVNKMWTLKPY
jgi:hypothetical protein